MKVLVPDVVEWNLALDGVDVVAFAPRSGIPEEHLDAEVLVLWGVPRWVIRDAAARRPRLRLVQGLMAGTDVVEAAGFGPEVILSSGRGLHDGPVAEHALALILAAARRLDRAMRAQQDHRWAKELGGLQPLDPAGGFRTLRGARVTIWGFGSIGTTLAPLLASLGAQVTGIARSAGERAGFPVVADTDVDRVLRHTDLLVMILPGGPQTRHTLDARRLALLPAHGWVVNVGRGTAVDEQALVAALTAGRLGGAALDVTEVEPLPPDSPLWDAPNTIITPHAAGGRPYGYEELVRANVEALIAGAPLHNVVAD